MVESNNLDLEKRVSSCDETLRDKDLDTRINIIDFYEKNVDVKNNYTQSNCNCLKKTYDYLSNVINNSSVVTKALVSGFLVSIPVNFLSTKIVSQYTSDIDILHQVSYWSEILSSSLTAGLILYNNHRKTGYTPLQSIANLIKVGIGGFVLSKTIYNPLRNFFTDVYMQNFNLPNESASVFSQGTAFIPFVLAMDFFTKPLKYVSKKIEKNKENYYKKHYYQKRFFFY